MKRETPRTKGRRVTETQRDRFYQRVRISVTLCLCGLVCSVALFTSVPRVFAQRKPLTLDDIYGPTTRVNFGGAPAPAFAWIDSGHYAWPRVIAGDRRSVEWLRVDAATGATEALFDATKAEAAIAALPGVVFLSGGQTDENATAHLDAMNRMGAPWPLTFSYSRALQAVALKAWRGQAGNVGAAQRYEYTVIGDPVNEAARLTELAKSRPSRALASESIVRRAADREARRWTLGEPVVLRGRPEATRVAAPL